MKALLGLLKISVSQYILWAGAGFDRKIIGKAEFVLDKGNFSG